MIIYHNINAMQSHREMKDKVGKLNKNAEKLSSGNRIVKASDDAAGLSISEKMRGQIRGLQQASKNGQDGISLVQTAEGAMQELQSSLHRIRELWVQRENDTNTDDDRDAIDTEIIQLLEGMDHISETTTFNEKKLLTGDLFQNHFQTGADANQSMDLTIESLNNAALRLPSTMGGVITILKPLDPNEINIERANEALKIVSGARSNLGAVQNALEHAINNLNNSAENVQAAESRIRDVDMAKEMMEYTKNNILLQGTQSLLAQANQSPQKILELLK